MNIDDFEFEVRDEWDRPEARNAGVAVQKKGIIGNITGMIGDAPHCQNLRNYFDEPDKHFPAGTEHGGDVALLALSNTFVVKLSGGPVYLNGVGVELRFRNEESELNKGLECRVLGLSPTSEYESVANVDGDVRTTLGLKVKSIEELKRRIFESAALPDSTDFSQKGNIGKNITIGTSAKIKAGIMFRHTWMRQRVEVWGCGSYEAHWKFFRDEKPFYNRDIEVLTLLAFDRYQAEINFEARLLLDVWAGVVPREVQSKWVPLRCKIIGNEP